MPYCTKCGTRLPTDNEARFCPNCGTPMTPLQWYQGAEQIGARAGKDRGTITLRSRVLLLVVFLAVSFMVTLFGALAKVDPAEARQQFQELERLQEVLEIAGIQLIFGNNLMYCLLMFAPVLGPMYGFYVLYSTGVVYAIMGLISKADPLVLLVSTFVLPHAWLEYISYSLALSESLWLVYAMVRRGSPGFKSELTAASKAVAICAILLLLAAVVEMLLISQFSA